MSDTENTQNQLSNIEAEQIELLTERIISNKPSDAEIIYNKRKHLGLTQKEFADKIGCSLSTIARIERGISPISARIQRKIDALDVQKPKELPLEETFAQSLSKIIIQNGYNSLGALYNIQCITDNLIKVFSPPKMDKDDARRYLQFLTLTIDYATRLCFEEQQSIKKNQAVLFSKQTAGSLAYIQREDHSLFNELQKINSKTPEKK